MIRPRTPADHIRDLDARLLVSGERLARYRAAGMETSVIVLRGVIDRLLDARLLCMRDRDRN